MRASSAVLATSVTIRARVAFALGLSELGINKVSDHSEVYAFCRSALDKAWGWLQGEAISPAALDELIQSPHGIDVPSYSTLVDSIPEKAYAMALIAEGISFAAYQAYVDAGDPHGMSESVAEAAEEFLDEMLEVALKTDPSFADTIDEAFDFILANYPADPSDLGQPIPRQTILQAFSISGGPSIA